MYCCCCLRPCFVRVLLTVCHVLLLLSSTMLCGGLVDSMSCIVVAVFDHALCGSRRQYVMYCCCCLQPCFVWVSSTVCHVLLLLSSTMLRAGLVDSMSCIVVAVFDHASCGSGGQYVMYCCCCLRPCFVRVLWTVCHVLLLLSSTMLCGGLVDSMSCIVVAVFDHALCGSRRQYVMYCCCCLRPCFVRVLLTVCHVLLLLSSTMLRTGLVDCMSCIVVAVFDHALWGSRRQYVMYCCCCLRPCFVRVSSTVCHVLLLLSSTMLCVGLVDSMSCIVVAVFDHASCGSCGQYVMYCCCCLRPCFVRVWWTVCHVLLLLSSTMLRAGLVDSMSCIVVAVFDHASYGSC